MFVMSNAAPLPSQVERPTMMTHRFYLPFIALNVFLILPAVADDWPQWMGPQRDNVWREDGLLDKFPESELKVLWRTPVAGGYAGPAVAQDRVVVTDYVTKDDVKVSNFDRKEFSGQERVQCLDEKTGEVLWKHEYPVKYTISYPAGPRCTPIIEEDRVYTLGAEGHLICFQLATGKILWQHHLTEKYNTKAALWGYAAHPLIDGDKLITLAGGEGSHVVAFNKRTGEEIWKALTSPEQGYSPPTIFSVGDRRELVLLRPDAVTAVDPESGKEHWSTPYEASNGSIIMSPIKYQDYMYVAGYSDRSLLLQVSEQEPAVEVVWKDKRREAFSPVNVQPFMQEDIAYGFDQSGVLCALKLPEGKRLWETAAPVSERRVGSGTAFIVKQGERFWLFNELGEVILAELSEGGYKELDRAKAIEPTNLAFGRSVVWSPPALANRHLYMRNDKEIICVDVAK